MTGVGILSVLLAWAVVHTVSTLHYADLYYGGNGGIDFNEDGDPDTGTSPTSPSPSA